VAKFNGAKLQSLKLESYIDKKAKAIRQKLKNDCARIANPRDLINFRLLTINYSLLIKLLTNCCHQPPLILPHNHKKIISWTH